MGVDVGRINPIGPVEPSRVWLPPGITPGCEYQSRYACSVTYQGLMPSLRGRACEVRPLGGSHWPVAVCIAAMQVVAEQAGSQTWYHEGPYNCSQIPDGNVKPRPWNFFINQCRVCIVHNVGMIG